MTTIKKLSSLTLLFLTMLLPLTACSTLSGKSIEGQVIEQGSNKPIDGAIVVVQWLGSVPSLADSHTVCVHVDTATTNTNGTYRIPAWHARSQVGPIVLDLGPTISAYTPARIQVSSTFNPPYLAYLEPTHPTNQERLTYLKRLSSASNCASAGESNKNLLPLRRAILKEAKQVADTKTDLDVLEFFVFQLEIIELGYEAAEKRQIERIRGKQ